MDLDVEMEVEFSSSDAFQLDMWRPIRVEFGIWERRWADTDESIPPDRAMAIRFSCGLFIGGMYGTGMYIGVVVVVVDGWEEEMVVSRF